MITGTINTIQGTIGPVGNSGKQGHYPTNSFD